VAVIAAAAGNEKSASARVTTGMVERTILVCCFAFIISPCMADRGV
jgi:hypothetical protein